MAKRPRPGDVLIDGDTYIIPFEDEVSLEVRNPEHQDQRRKLMANVCAHVAAERVNDQTFDLKNGQRRIDYAAVAAHLDGRVDWVSCLMLAIEPLERAMAPQGQADASDPPITTPTSIPVRPFPVEVFPAAIATLIRQGAAALPCAPDLIEVPMLAVLGTAVGTSYDVEMKQGWTESPRIYSGVIALPGDKKSPAEKLATRPLHVLQVKHGQDFEAQQVQHDLAILVYEVQLADWRGKRRKKVDSQQPEETKQPPPPKPNAPTMTQLLTVGATVEALASILHSNPRGLLMERAEQEMPHAGVPVGARDNKIDLLLTRHTQDFLRWPSNCHRDLYWCDSRSDRDHLLLGLFRQKWPRPHRWRPGRGVRP